MNDGGSTSALKTARASVKSRLNVDIGTVTFTEIATGGVKVSIAIASTSTHATDGNHAMHIHETAGKCEAQGFTTAGAHWNPAAAMHGDPDSGEHHAGDLGQVSIARSGFMGVGTREFTSTLMSLDASNAMSILNLPVIFHEKPDTFTMQPAGAAGSRWGCGLITLQP